MSDEHEHDPDQGHTFRIAYDSRGSYAVVGDKHHTDAPGFDGIPHAVDVRAWNLRDALRAVAELSFGDLMGEEAEALGEAFVARRCRYEDVWTDEVGEIPVCVVHGNNSRHVDSDDPHRPCLTVDPYPVSDPWNPASPDYMVLPSPVGLQGNAKICNAPLIVNGRVVGYCSRICRKWGKRAGMHRGDHELTWRTS